MPSLTSNIPDIRSAIQDCVDTKITAISYASRDEFGLTYDVVLEDRRVLTLRLPNAKAPLEILESEIATMKYIAEKTSIPVPQVLFSPSHTAVPNSTPRFALLEKPAGVNLDTIFGSLQPNEQDSLVTQVAGWMLEIFLHRLSSIGNLFREPDGTYRVGPVVRSSWYADGRAHLSIERGPFDTVKAYYFACAQREIESARALFVQDASPAYQRDLEESRLQVERIVGLLYDLVNRCEGLDEDDPLFTSFSLDVHSLGLENIVVSSAKPTEIISVVDWRFYNTRPLWCCARVPAWLRPSLSTENDADKPRLLAVFRAEITRKDGPESIFLRLMDAEEDTRCMLDDLSDYDAFKDGFLLLPALENILATLPGQEDVAGLAALLDPDTLPGRVARINLLTHGSNSMFLAMTPSASTQTSITEDFDAGIRSHSDDKEQVIKTPWLEVKSEIGGDSIGGTYSVEVPKLVDPAQ